MPRLIWTVTYILKDFSRQKGKGETRTTTTTTTTWQHYHTCWTFGKHANIEAALIWCGGGVWCVGWWWCVICVMVDGGDIDLGEEMRIGSWCGASVTLRPSLKPQIFYNFDNKSIIFISLPSRTPSKTPCTLIWSGKIIFGYASSPTPFAALLV